MSALNFKKDFSILSNKFLKDVSWNFVGVIVLGISGLFLNFTIGRFYGPSILGVFNQVFALYIFLSQIAVFGIYFSVLKHIAEFSDDINKCSNILIWAIAITILFSSIVTCVVFLLSKTIGDFFKSDKITPALIYILPALWCTGLNKVLMAALNGYRHMKTFAVAQTMRYVFMIFALIGFVFFRVKGVALTGIISIAEGILLFFLFFYAIKSKFLKLQKIELKWITHHIKFGLKSFLSGTIAELNTRVDVLMLGYFCSDRKVGIYSMAALILEGLMMFSYVVRDNLNPILAKLISKNQIKKLKEITKSVIKIWYLIILVISVVAILVYPWFIKIFIKKSDFLKGWSPFTILMIGYILSSGYIPLNMILVQAGFPGIHTILKIIITLSNIILNLFLIQLAGIDGAAYATATAFVLSVIYLKILVRKTLKLKI